MSKEPSLNMVLCLVVGEYIFSSKGEWKKKENEDMLRDDYG